MPTAERRLERAADDKLFTSEELTAVLQLGEELCDYIERCRRSDRLQLDGGIRAGVDHILRTKAMPMLAQRAKALLAAASPASGVTEAVAKLIADADSHGCQRCWSDDLARPCTCAAERSLIKQTIRETAAALIRGGAR